MWILGIYSLNFIVRRYNTVLKSYASPQPPLIPSGSPGVPGSSGLWGRLRCDRGVPHRLVFPVKQDGACDHLG